MSCRPSESCRPTSLPLPHWRFAPCHWYQLYLGRFFVADGQQHLAIASATLTDAPTLRQLGRWHGSPRVQCIHDSALVLITKVTVVPAPAGCDDP